MTRHMIVREFWNENWADYCTDTYPIIYASAAEAATRKHELESGADPSWHQPDNGFLSVVSVELDQ